MAFDIIKTFKEELLKTTGISNNEVRLSIDEGLQLYTENWFHKISNVKTFLFNENSVGFEDVYVPLSLRYEKNTIEIPDNVELLFKINNYLTIVGHAGSGKTMLMKHCFLNILQRANYIPVIIELRRIDSTTMSLAEYVSSTVFKLNLVRSESVFNKLLSEGRFIFFLDGFDEIAIKNKEIRSSQIEEFTDRYNKNLFMLTSRPGAGAESFSRFRTYHVCEMNEKQIRLFVEKQARYMDEDGEQIAKKIISTIYGSKNTTIKEYLSNPLLLSMFILTFKYTPELPSKKSGFYFNVFDTLYCKHDTTSKTGGYLHEKKCKMEREQYLSFLQTFSYDSYLSSKYEFDSLYINEEFEKLKKKLNLKFQNDSMLYDLSVSIGILVLDGLNYNFPHRSMQEYFAASLISKSEENSRKLVYTNILTRKYGFDGFNFWSLCEEMDEFCFLKYFILDNLKSFKNKLLQPIEGIEETRQVVLCNCLNTIPIQVRLEKGKLRYIRHSANLYSSILRYLHRDVDFVDVIIDWIISSETSLSKLQKYENDTIGSIVTFDINNKEVMTFIFNSSLPEMLFTQYEKLTDLIKNLESDLNSKRRHEIDLLNIC